MARIEIDGLRKHYGAVEVLKGIDLTVADQEFVVFVGRSGCGKSTLLRCVAGLETITNGTIRIDGQDVTSRAPSKRGIAMVFQSYALYPHMTVFDNMAFSLKLAARPRAEIADRVGRAARVLRIEELLERRPAQLSGGQRQRVAIGRAIVRSPKAFLFDEPLSNLDADLRVQMRQELMQLHQELAATMIYVTHDQIEAMTMADKIVVMNAGQIEQVGTPLELYAHPRNLFVATFIGSPRMNILEVTIPAADGGSALLAGKVPIALGLLESGSRSTKLGIRPEHVQIVGSAEGQVEGIITLIEHLGADSYYVVDIDGAAQVNARSAGTQRLQRGETVGLRFSPDNIYHFGPDGTSLTRPR